MTKYREILRLKSLGVSEWNIAHSCGVSRNTVVSCNKETCAVNIRNGKIKAGIRTGSLTYSVNISF